MGIVARRKIVGCESDGGRREGGGGMVDGMGGGIVVFRAIVV